MKKLLLTILIILLCILTYVIMFNNFKIGIFEIESISKIKGKSDELEQKLNQATELTAQTYPKAKSTLDSSVNKLKSTKQQYENKIASMPDSEILRYMQVENYEKEFLWTTIGSYATKENLDLELDIVDIKNNDYYNLDFTVVGRYSDIAEFIFAIENDDKLGFKIEKFSMKPYTVSEKTKVTTYGGEEPQSEETTDSAYDVTKEKSYTGSKDEEGTKTGLVGSTNISTNTTNSQTTQTTNSKNSNQTNTSVTIMYSPDRVKATFTVTKVNVNVK